jgi:putrescine aminotransferase
LESKRTIIARRHAYHGMHGFGTSLAGIDFNREGYGGDLISDVAIVDESDPRSLEDLIERVGADRLAAFFCEPVLGVGGVIPPAPGYLERVRALCREHDILFVADEVITGFGRLGSMFASDRYRLEPDLLVFAKGVTSGYQPLGGFIASPKAWRPFWEETDAPIFRHGLTYSGHPAACAAALANLDILEDEALTDRVAELEPQLERIAGGVESHPAVMEVRSVGLLAGVQVRDADLAARVAAAAPDKGLVLRPMANATLQISPPFIAEPHELEFVISAIGELLDDLA